MKKIMVACLQSTSTAGEYQWIESDECEYGREWDGDLMGYLENLDVENISEDIERGKEFYQCIHNLPEESIVLADKDGIPYEIYWVEEVDEEEED